MAKTTSIWRIASVAAIGSTLALTAGASTPTAAKQQMKQAVREMDSKTIVDVQKERLNSRGSLSTQGARPDTGVPDIDYSTLSCPTKCIFSC